VGKDVVTAFCRLVPLFLHLLLATVESGCNMFERASKFALGILFVSIFAEEKKFIFLFRLFPLVDGGSSKKYFIQHVCPV